MLHIQFMHLYLPYSASICPIFRIHTFHIFHPYLPYPATVPSTSCIYTFHIHILSIFSIYTFLLLPSIFCICISYFASILSIFSIYTSHIPHLPSIFCICTSYFTLYSKHSCLKSRQSFTVCVHNSFSSKCV